MGPIWADRTPVGTMLAPWTLLSGKKCFIESTRRLHSVYPNIYSNQPLSCWIYFRKQKNYIFIFLLPFQLRAPTALILISLSQNIPDSEQQGLRDVTQATVYTCHYSILSWYLQKSMPTIFWNLKYIEMHLWNVILPQHSSWNAVPGRIACNLLTWILSLLWQIFRE